MKAAIECILKQKNNDNVANTTYEKTNHIKTRVKHYSGRINLYGGHFTYLLALVFSGVFFLFSRDTVNPSFYWANVQNSFALHSQYHERHISLHQIDMFQEKKLGNHN